MPFTPLYLLQINGGLEIFYEPAFTGTCITFDGKDRKLNLEAIYRESDLAVYHAKKSGRNTVVHYDDLGELDKTG